MHRRLHDATALVASLSLLVPALPAAAQDALDVDALTEACAATEGDDLVTCLTAQLALSGIEPTDEAIEQTLALLEASDGGLATAAEAELESEAAIDDQTAGAEAETAAEAEVAAEAAVTPERGETQSEAAAEAEERVEELLVPADEGGSDAPGAVAEQDGVIQPPAAEEAPVVVEAEQVEEAPADPVVVEEVTTEPEAPEAPAQVAEPAAPSDGTGGTLETQGAQNGAEALQADAVVVEEEAPAPAQQSAAPQALTVEEEAPAEALVVEEELPQEQQVQSELAADVASQPEPELNEEQQQAARQTEAALSALDALTGRDGGEGGISAAVSAAAAALSTEPAPEARVVEETVEAEDVRRSDEDFATRAIETAPAATERSEGGLSNREKFALGALGLLAVGTVLNNRTRVVSNSGDRVVVATREGDLQVLKDDDALLRQEGDRVRTETFDDGSTRTIVTRDDGSQVITVRDASLRVLRRIVVETDGTEYVLIDDTQPAEPVVVEDLPEVAPAVAASRGGASDPLRDALRAELGVDRRYTLAQVRTIAEVRALAPAFEVDTVTFESGSAAIQPDQARNLAGLAREVVDLIRRNPREVFLVEGHTDAVGDAAYNLALSDRRAESLALALNEYFGVPVENLVVQGYGERFLKVPTEAAERANRRATVRQITDLLRTAAAN